MKKFEVNEIYYSRSVCDDNCVWFYQIVKKTDKNIWVQQLTPTTFSPVFENNSYRTRGEVVRKKIKCDPIDGHELIFPQGTYSMAPILTAEKKLNKFVVISSEQKPSIDATQEAITAEIEKDLLSKFQGINLVRCEDKYTFEVTNLHSINYSDNDLHDYCKKYHVRNIYPVIIVSCSNLVLQELETMVCNYVNSLDCYNGLIHENVATVKGIHWEYYEQLLLNQCYCDLSDKPTISNDTEVNTVVPKLEIIKEETETNTIPTQQEIKEEIKVTKKEIAKISKLINYLESNNIYGEIYDLTQSNLDELNRKLSNLESQLDPTVEIKKAIEVKADKLNCLSSWLTEAITRMDLTAVNEIQQDIAKVVQEIQLLQQRLNDSSSNVVRLFG